MQRAGNRHREVHRVRRGGASAWEWEKAAKEKKGVRDFYADFTKALEQVAPGDAHCRAPCRLKEFQREVMEKFQAAYALAQGDDFKPKSGNLVAIVRNLVRSTEFTEKFKGLAIFFDEFGTAVLQNSRFDTAVMQAFMEDICQHAANVVFVGCIHKSFKDYAERTNQATAAVMEARSHRWRWRTRDRGNHRCHRRDGEGVGGLEEGNSAKGGRVRSAHAAVRDVKAFPVDHRNRPHPREGAGGHLRDAPDGAALPAETVVGDRVGCSQHIHIFLRGGAVTQPGSYAEFIENNEIVGSNAALRLYLVDQLFEFFEKELSPGSRELLDVQRGFVNGYVASLQALKKSVSAELFDEQQDDRVALLRTVLIYSLCGVSTTLENIQFGRYCLSNSEKSQVKKLLSELEKAGAIYLRKTSNTYELCATEGQDPVVLVDSFADLPETHELATTAELLKQVGSVDEFLVANGWNLPFGEDKRLKRRFVRGRELGSDLWAQLEQEAAAAGAKFGTSFEGHAVYACARTRAR